MQYVCGMQVGSCVYIWRPKEVVYDSTYSLRQGLSENLELGWRLSSPTPLISVHDSAGVTGTPSNFYVGAGELNSGFHCRAASVLSHWALSPVPTAYHLMPEI